MRTAAREVVAADVTTALARARSAFAGLGARIVEDDRTGRLVGRTGVSWRSWGERIEVVPTARGGHTHVAVRVETVVRLTLVDYGASDAVAGEVASAVAHDEVAGAQLAHVGERVRPAFTVWLGVAGTGAAAVLAEVFTSGQQRTELLVAALVAAALWAVAVVTGAIRVRRRGDYRSPVQGSAPLVAVLVIGLLGADFLKPRHTGAAVSASADLASACGTVAVVALAVALVRRVRRSRS